MSFAMIQAFKSVEGLHPSARLVAYMLADCHNDQTGLCNPSVSYLMQVTSLSERGVQNAITVLIEAELVTRELTGRTPRYTLNPRTSCTPATVAPRSDCPSEAQTVHLCPATVAPTPATVAPKPELTRREPERNSLSADRIASLYPKPGDLPVARETILARLEAGESAEAIEANVRRCVEAMRRAPSGAANQYWPKVDKFFREGNDKLPEEFEARTIKLLKETLNCNGDKPRVTTEFNKPGRYKSSLKD